MTKREQLQRKMKMFDFYEYISSIFLYAFSACFVVSSLISCETETSALCVCASALFPVATNSIEMIFHPERKPPLRGAISKMWFASIFQFDGKSNDVYTAIAACMQSKLHSYYYFFFDTRVKLNAANRRTSSAYNGSQYSSIVCFVFPSAHIGIGT